MEQKTDNHVCMLGTMLGGAILPSSFVMFRSNNERHCSLSLLSAPNKKRPCTSAHGRGFLTPLVLGGERWDTLTSGQSQSLGVARLFPVSGLCPAAPKRHGFQFGQSGSHSPNRHVLHSPTLWGSFLTGDKVTLLECGVDHAAPFFRVLRGLPPASS